MRWRSAVLVCVLMSASALFAKDVYLGIGGSVGNFRTDARIFNPSFDSDVTITARYLPAGNVDNSAVASKTIVVAKRSMAVYDDVVQSLFGGGPALGAIRLTADADFVATQRIFADESDGPQNGTLGQFVPGFDSWQALEQGVLVQLVQSGSKGEKGTFRTNWGGVNPNATAAQVTLELYDRDNALAATKTLTLEPYGVFAPSSIRSFFDNPTNDLTNAWIRFVADQPLFLYGSVLDNGSEDPTFIPAAADSGVEPDPAPELKTVTVTAKNWVFTVESSAPLKAGDTVKFELQSAESTHGFQLVSPSGVPLIDVASLSDTTVERTITLPEAGEYFYYCTYTLCGQGHTNMNGTMSVGE